MATWRLIHVFKKANCPTRWKLIVYYKMIRSKLLCGLETLFIPKARYSVEDIGA
jgi:hypothetical protein